MKIALFCGQSSYPRRDSATANRYRALAEMTANLGHEVIFVNRHPAVRLDEPQSPPQQFGVINASGLHRKKGWIRRQFARALSGPREAWKIIELSNSKPVSIINVYSQYSLDLLYYYLISKAVGAECIIHVVEYRSKIVGRGPLLRFNDLVYEAIATALFSRFVAISSTIEKALIEANPQVNVVVVPPVCRFDQISQIQPTRLDKRYFLYCASLAYEDVAWFVIESFLKLDTRSINLILVLNGDLSDRIQKICKINRAIIVLSQLEYDHLLGLYKGAHALLIPLRNIAQDTARYPQKISEYMASGRPIISCKVGDIAKHFTHGIDALLANSYEVHEYAELMKFCLSHDSEIADIATKGYTLGLKLFDVRSQEKNLRSLLI